MIYAGQKALFQEQNQKVLDIRQAEMDYFIHFYSNIVTQITLVIGSVIGSASNIKEHDDSYALSDIFYFSAALTFGFGMHVIICATFIVVTAPNLALHGPVGSMISAVDGMIAEKDHVFVSFCLCLCSWTFNQILMFWLLMTDQVAIVVTFVLVGFSSVWYSYTLRIYNRFKMHATTRQFDDDLKFTSDKQDLKSSLATHKQNKFQFDRNGPTLKNANSSTFNKNILHTRVGETNSESSSNSAASVNTLFSNNQAISETKVTGYMSFCIKSMSRSQAKLQRKFFVLDFKLKVIVYYPSEHQYESDPSKPETPRPIKLSEYTLNEVNSDQTPYRILLKESSGMRGDIEFIIDTFEDLQKWNDSFRFCCSTVDEDDDV